MQSRIWAAAIALSVAATSAFGAISNTVTIGTQTVTETVGVNWTQTATLIGAQDGESIGVAEFSSWCDCIPWETFCSITKRVPRIYKTARH